MVGKMLLPLLLIVGLVAGDDIKDLCSQFEDQFNKLENLLPLEVDVTFPLKGGVIRGIAKYRLVSSLDIVGESCVTTASGSNTRTVQIKLKNTESYIMTPTKIYNVLEPSYTLVLQVEDSESGDSKTVSVADFTIESTRIMDGVGDIAQKDYVNAILRRNILKKLQKKLNTRFQTEERVEINGKLARDLMINIFEVFAQDL